jgi:hypothetical protein
MEVLGKLTGPAVVFGKTISDGHVDVEFLGVIHCARNKGLPGIYLGGSSVRKTENAGC